MRILWPESSDSPTLSPNEVHIWALDLDVAAVHWNRWWDLLSHDERQRAEQFRLEAPRRRFVIARAALRILLGQQLQTSPKDIAVSIAPGGKPQLADAPRSRNLRFNVAHSGEVAIIAFAVAFDVGVDVEHLRPVRHAEHIARRYFHPNEWRLILAAASSDRDAAFMQVWTTKEAVLKALGSGITGSLADFSVPADVGSGAPVQLPSARCWVQQLLPCHGYIGAVATVGARRTVRCFAFNW